MGESATGVAGSFWFRSPPRWGGELLEGER